MSRRGHRCATRPSRRVTRLTGARRAMLCGRLRPLAARPAAGPLIARAVATRANPYAVLGVKQTASADEIRERYLELARKQHPDVASGETEFSQVSAAYTMLRDPQNRSQVDQSLNAPEQLAAESLDAARIGRVAEGMHLLVSTALTLMPHPDVVNAASELLHACASRGEPHHALASRLWRALHTCEAVDSRACNAWFTISLRAGHTREAMHAIKHAETHGLDQSVQMQSTARQVRRFRDTRRGLGSKERTPH